MKSISVCDKAVSITIGYVLFSGIFLIFFIILLLVSNDLLVAGSSDIVVKDQYSDIGNMISTKIMDMYLIAPENGYIETEFRIPSEIGKEGYVINANAIETDETIEINSTVSDKKISVTLNGIARSMPITGTAYSNSANHTIRYESPRR